MFGDRTAIRRAYREAWLKYAGGEVLSPLEAQIAAIVGEHPEYHGALEENAEDAEFTRGDGGINPFLHMGLHLAIRDQVKMDRPQGIGVVYRALLQKHGDRHEVEHRMFDALAETLSEAQRRGGEPDDAAYLERLRSLC